MTDLQLLDLVYYYSNTNITIPGPLNPPDNEAAHTDLPKDVTPPTTEEIKMTIRKIKSGKAAGPDNIPTEALKSDTEVTANTLHLLFRKTRGEEQVPTD